MLSRIATIIALPVLLVAATLGTSGSAHATPTELHFQLVKSDPAGDTVVGQAPAAVKLWFSQEPEIEGARVRVMGPDEVLVTMGDVHQDEADKTLVSAAILGELQPGTQTVIWRAMGRDGHVVTGEFTFSYDTATDTR